MAVLDPERPYTPYQRRQLISALAKKKNIDIFEATTQFKAMEQANPEGLEKLIATFDKDPEKPEDE
jgi:hypothetical protein